MSRTAPTMWVSVGIVLVACAGRTDLDGTPRQGNPLFVQVVLFPTPVAQGSSCTYTADPNQVSLSSGVLDLANTYEVTGSDREVVSSREAAPTKSGRMSPFTAG